MASILDSQSTYEKFDASGARYLVRALPDQCRKAWQEGKAFSLPSAYRGVDQIVIVGMGGSAIGGDLLRSITLDTSSTPVTVSREYTLPRHVGANTLVIASSYSGNTEETLSAFDEALKRGCKTVVSTSGGLLADVARGRGIPLFEITFKGPPRTAVAYGLFPILAMLQNLDVIPTMDGQLEDAVQSLERIVDTIHEEVPEEDNEAKQIARSLEGKLPIIYGSGILSEVARRWKTQINENSKSWAFFEILPELHHNTATGYQFPSWAKNHGMIVMLTAKSIHPRVSLRYKITEEILQENGIPHLMLGAKGSTPLSQMMSGVLLGDYVSLYLAMLNQVDPTPVPTIDYIKSRLG